jgi:taurine---2-oxoglutarate transaminase
VQAGLACLRSIPVFPCAMDRTKDIQAKHTKYVLTPWMAQAGLAPPVIERALGSYLWDVAGNKYFDLASGLIAVNLGHSHPKIVQAIQEQAAKLCYAAPSLFSEARADLAEELSRISPFKEGARTFFVTGGAEANDDVVRIARHLTGRSKVLAAYRSYHGSTGTAIQLTGEDRRWAGETGLPGLVRFFAPFPYRSPFFTEDPKEECERALASLERILVHEDPARVAAILIEPVVGSNGVIVYPDGYLAGLRAMTEKYGILLIFDEVMTGFGRTGAAFAAQRFGVTPDLLTFAKGVSSAYIPLGGIMIRESLAATFDDKPLPSGHTYSGHPLTIAAGLAALQVYRDEGIFARALEMETWLKAGLTALHKKHAIIGDVRGLGAFHAIEFVRDRATKEPLVAWHGKAGLGIMKNLYAELRKRGVYTFGKFNITMVAPPLTASKAEVEAGFVALDDGIAAFAASL